MLFCTVSSVQRQCIIVYDLYKEDKVQKMDYKRSDKQSLLFLKLIHSFFLWRYHNFIAVAVCKTVQSWIDRISLEQVHNDTVSTLENLTNFKQLPHYNKKWNEVKAYSFGKYRNVKDMKA